MLLLFLFLVSLFPPRTAMNAALPSENGVVGTPKIICGTREIHIEVQTESKFMGKMFIKGFFANPLCRVNSSMDTSSLTLTLSIPVTSECGVRRQRQISPRGIILDTTVIVMFHPVFLTMIDKSYHVQCNYMETDTEVTEAIDVNSVAPTELPQNQQQQHETQMPKCKYEVLTGGAMGRPLKIATIGEKVYHKWSCEGVDADAYCMTVHSCTADDGQGVDQLLIDDQGCTLDQFLLPNLVFSSDLVAGQDAHVFKFADRPTVFFSCMIRLELREEQQTKCPRPMEYCTSDLFNRSRPMEQNRISDDFPTPNPEALTEGPDAIPDDYDVFDPEASTDNLQAQQSFRIVRDLNRYSMDLDVSAPAVDVVELSEQDTSNIRQEIDMSRGEPMVCLSRIHATLSLCLFVCISSISFFAHFLLLRRGSRKVEKQPIPSPFDEKVPGRA